MEIKGLVIDTKTEKKAVLVMRPKGQTAIVKGGGKRFRAPAKDDGTGGLGLH